MQCKYQMMNYTSTTTVSKFKRLLFITACLFLLSKFMSSKRNLSSNPGRESNKGNYRTVGK
ncbi:hypothetical protein H8S95_02120 [Pontibacter sp. KCTC 32443]|uniref:hypothetical protein n=1 Tax=Pontibacter TaxID=323449 RepID=UPI00164EC2BB|nr:MULTISPECIES: hypothetical protein [Pontibacter]MBC5772845.1 hypothetical protein [Pontibacter sp. KCTC 32443]